MFSVEIDRIYHVMEDIEWGGWKDVDLQILSISFNIIYKF